MGINTHTKRLTGWFKAFTSRLVKTLSRLHIGIRKAGPALVEGTSEGALHTKKGILRFRKKMTATFKRPLSDVSHLSIILVICLALTSGLSMMSFNNDNNQPELLLTSTSGVKTTTVYISKEKKRAQEADAVATIAGWYSNDLGADAGQIAGDINNKINTMGTRYASIVTVPVLSVSQTAVGSDGQIKKYIVQNGDTLSTIAAKFGISTDTVRYANGITDADSISPGQELVILPASGVLHTVKSGDTLSGISSTYGVAEAIIISANNLEGVDIAQGMKLMVPGGTIPEAPKPQPVAQNSSTSSSGGSRGSTTQMFGNGSFMFPTSNQGGGYYNGYHNWAIDIQGVTGTPIYASDSGRIVEARYGGGYGITILIDHGNGFQTRYAHMSRLAVIDGYVAKGQVIGYVGNTGNSTGSHLHFEIISGGVMLNPCRYFGGCSG